MEATTTLLTSDYVKYLNGLLLGNLHLHPKSKKSE
jgi:hypothetical protein